MVESDRLRDTRFCSKIIRGRSPDTACGVRDPGSSVSFSRERLGEAEPLLFAEVVIDPDRVAGWWSRTAGLMPLVSRRVEAVAGAEIIRQRCDGDDLLHQSRWDRGHPVGIAAEDGSRSADPRLPLAGLTGLPCTSTVGTIGVGIGILRAREEAVQPLPSRVCDRRWPSELLVVRMRCPFVQDEKEGLVLDDRSADTAAELVADQEGPRRNLRRSIVDSVPVVAPAVGVQPVVAQHIPGAAVKLVGSGPGAHLDLRGAAANTPRRPEMSPRAPPR